MNKIGKVIIKLNLHIIQIQMSLKKCQSTFLFKSAILHTNKVRLYQATGIKIELTAQFI